MKNIKNKVLALLVGLGTFSCAYGFASCNWSSSSSGDSSSVESSVGTSLDSSADSSTDSGSVVTELLLSRTELSMDVYDEVTISVLTDVDGTITWTSSAPDVVGVVDGKVTAIKDGVATITATWGELTATCKVTVVNSHTAPVLKVDQESIGVEKGEELSFSAKVLWKGEDVSADATYAWSLDEAATGIVELTGDANTSTVTFKGLNYGEVECTVTATYRDITVAKTIYDIFLIPK